MMFVRGKVEERFSTFFICANFSSMIYHFFFIKKLKSLEVSKIIATFASTNKERLWKQQRQSP